MLYLILPEMSLMQFLVMLAFSIVIALGIFCALSPARQKVKLEPEPMEMDQEWWSYPQPWDKP